MRGLEHLTPAMRTLRPASAGVRVGGGARGLQRPACNTTCGLRTASPTVGNMSDDTSAVDQTRRQLKVAREALQVAKSVAALDSPRDNELIAQLEQDIADLEATIGVLERGPRSQAGGLALSHDDVASYRPDTRRGRR